MRDERLGDADPTLLGLDRQVTRADAAQVHRVAHRRHVGHRGDGPSLAGTTRPPIASRSAATRSRTLAPGWSRTWVRAATARSRRSTTMRRPASIPGASAASPLRSQPRLGWYVTKPSQTSSPPWPRPRATRTSTAVDGRRRRQQRVDAGAEAHSVDGDPTATARSSRGGGTRIAHICLDPSTDPGPNSSHDLATRGAQANRRPGGGGSPRQQSCSMKTHDRRWIELGP